MIDIVIVGSGNVAFALATALTKKRGINIVEINSRNPKQGKELSEKVGSNYNMSIERIAKADLYIVAVKDSAIDEVVTKIGNIADEESLICHTSAMARVLEGQKFGRLYPLQSFSKGRECDFSKITFFIETNSSKKEQILITLCTELESNFCSIEGEILQKVHLAATFANNFSNRMFHYAEQLLQSEGLERGVIMPLLEESIDKLREKDLSVRQLQSGAAVRRDDTTIKHHKALLKQSKEGEEMLEVYNLITNKIYNDNKF